MKLKEAIENINLIQYQKESPKVIETSVKEIVQRLHNDNIRVEEVEAIKFLDTAFQVEVPNSNNLNDFRIKELLNKEKNYIYFQLNDNGSGLLISSHSYYLFSFIHFLFNNLLGHDVDEFRKGKLFKPAFNWNRISYDYFLTQEGRIQRNLDRESYIKELARLGFTHVEINGLGFPEALESGPKGETYPMFYTYCPALDQFVDSHLNEGLYPKEYLNNNLEFLKENARYALKYGISPGLLCFEPRSVPEEFFIKYPMLRGARVDHPFRSFKPRYNMTITHPRVLEHYEEMLQKLIREVPELEYITIWTNDSGAGFEHTKSLYVGRNGGAYLIREWKDDEEIARLAGENALKFFRTLRDAGSKINPDFRVITRLESFYGEHETIWKGLEDQIDVEVASLISKGWEMPYSHPKYEDNKDINAGTVYQQKFDEKEKKFIAELQEKGSKAHFYFTAGPHSMFEPLLGIPYPNLTYKRLQTLHNNGIKNLANTGGSCPGELVPFNINHEILHLFQYNHELDIDITINNIASNWAGEYFYLQLVNAWKLVEESILAFPNISSLYSTFGFTWYRLWIRPFVPNIEAIPQEDRNYYENFMCTTPHNPNNVDLSRDVLFQLTTPEKCNLDIERIDKNLWQPLDKAIENLNNIKQEATQELGENNVINDQLVRMIALRCWFMTQRNVAAWIAGVYGYLNTEDELEKSQNRDLLTDMILKEIKNTNTLIELSETGIEFMAITDKGETQLVYGDNFNSLLERRIELMEIHKNDEPFIDFDYIMAKSGKIIN